MRFIRDNWFEIAVCLACFGVLALLSGCSSSRTPPFPEQGASWAVNYNIIHPAPGTAPNGHAWSAPAAPLPPPAPAWPPVHDCAAPSPLRSLSTTPECGT